MLRSPGARGCTGGPPRPETCPGPRPGVDHPSEIRARGWSPGVVHPIRVGRRDRCTLSGMRLGGSMVGVRPVGGHLVGAASRWGCTNYATCLGCTPSIPRRGCASVGVHPVGRHLVGDAPRGGCTKDGSRITHYDPRHGFLRCKALHTLQRIHRYATGYPPPFENSKNRIASYN